MKLKPAISYLRFSSKAQSLGDSYRRQVTATEKWCHENGYELSKQLEDLGVSAFNGSNLDDTSALGGFVKLIERGKIPKGTVLVCENLDRLSRGQILDALGLFTSILKGGVDILTTMDKKYYSRESVTKNPMDLMIRITILTRGREESETKSDRAKQAWKGKYSAIEKGEVVKCPHPAWIKIVGGQYTVSEYDRETIKIVFDLYLGGMGVVSLQRELIKTGRKNFTNNKWNLQVIHKLLQNEAVIGIKPPILQRVIDDKGNVVKNEDDTIKKVQVCASVPNYYPPVISEDTFYKALEQRKHNNALNCPVRSNDREVSLFSGLMKCSKCGSTMNVRGNYKLNKYFYYICYEGLRGNCECGTVSKIKTDDSFRAILYTKQFRNFIQPKEETRVDNTPIIQGKLAKLEKTISRVAQSVIDTESSALVQRLKLLEVEKKQLEKQLEEEKMIAVTTQNDTLNFGSIVAGLHTQFKNNEFRFRLRNTVRKVVTQFVIGKNGYELTFANGSSAHVVFNKNTFDLVTKGKTERFFYDSFKMSGHDKNYGIDKGILKHI
jgi:DNA invertase Pin-like site-specific DNA recombinase